MFEEISFLLRASKFCFGAAIFFLVLAALLFFVFDIKNVLMIETGSGRRRTVQEMNERNQRTGKLRTESDLSSGGSTKENTGRAKTSGKDTKESDRKRGGSQKSGTLTKGKDISSQSEITAKFNQRKTSDAGSANLQKSLETVYLDEGSPGNGSGFTITQKLIVTHTDESIPV